MILKSENLPRIGDKVVNENLQSVGTVFDIFGPTSHPYVAIKPNVKEPQNLVNHVLYVIPSSSKPKWEKRR